MEKIKSFEVDHTLLEPGIYISRKDGDVVTYDLRMRKPNAGDYMDNVTMHSVEHMMATYLRNSYIGEEVLYFGPMGCRTGFYLLVRDTWPNTLVLEEIRICLLATINSTEMFGASEIECGNYRELDLEKAKAECQRYLNVLNQLKQIDFKYKKNTAPAEPERQVMWRRFALTETGEANEAELNSLLGELHLTRHQLALIVLGLRAQPGFSLQDFDA